jgi:hypothetical protein
MTEEDTVARTDGGEATSAVDAELNRDIGIVGAIALGVGTMIAAGIFVLSGLAVSNVGAMAIVAFLAPRSSLPLPRLPTPSSPRSIPSQVVGTLTSRTPSTPISRTSSAGR